MSAELSSFTLWESCIGFLMIMRHFVLLPNFLEKRKFGILGVWDYCKGRLKAVLSNIKTLSADVFYK